VSRNEGEERLFTPVRRKVAACLGDKNAQLKGWGQQLLREPQLNPIHIFVSIHIHIYICLYTHIHIYIYIHTHICTPVGGKVAAILKDDKTIQLKPQGSTLGVNGLTRYIEIYKHTDRYLRPSHHLGGGTRSLQSL